MPNLFLHQFCLKKHIIRCVLDYPIFRHGSRYTTKSGYAPASACLENIWKLLWLYFDYVVVTCINLWACILLGVVTAEIGALLTILEIEIIYQLRLQHHLTTDFSWCPGPGGFFLAEFRFVSFW